MQFSNFIFLFLEKKERLKTMKTGKEWQTKLMKTNKYFLLIFLKSIFKVFSS